MADLRELKDRAAEHLRKGRFARAAEALREVVRADPRDQGSRQKLGDALRRAGESAEALRTYREVADRYASGGELIKAIAVCKVILEIDPQHEETQAALAELYGRRRHAPSLPPRTPSQPQVHREPTLKPVSGSGTTGVPLELEMVDGSGTGAIPLELDRRDRSSGGFTPVPRPGSAESVFEVPVPPPGDEPPAVHVPTDELPFPGASPRDGGAGASRAADAEGTRDLVDFSAYEPPPGQDQPRTPFEQFVSAARDAAGAGVDEGVFIELDELPDGDEPLEAVPAPPEPELPVPVLPEIPLFSDLSREAFVQLARELVRREVAPGEHVVRQGEPGDALFVVASGTLRVEREVEGRTALLARLSEGEFFGEMALLSGEPRMASIVADEPSELLEIRAEALTALCRAHPHVAESLTRFYRRRLLANAMMTSPVFRPFARSDRANLARRFRTREVATGEVIVREGQKSDGMYIALSGRYEVRRGAGPAAQLVATLREGDLFGEISCLRKQPAGASVVAARPGILLRLPRADFDSVAMAHPQMLELIAGVADERAPDLDATPAAARAEGPGPFLV